MAKKLSIGILGASGYTGADLLRLLWHHEHVNIDALGAGTAADSAMAEVFPQFRNLNLPRLQTLDSIDYSQLDAVFCALPHATSQEVIANMPKSLKIIDLSADFRLRDTDIYAKWYGGKHLAADLQKEAVYGLTEHYREEIKKARLVACPGCYPTAALLLLLPLVRGGVIDPHDIIIDAKSGVSGAGRSLKRGNLFCEAGESMRAYGLAHHRHMPEIEQEISLVAGEDVIVGFSPHLVPMSRGEYLTVYAKLAAGQNADSLREILQNSYKDEEFVHICADGEIPSTADVRGSNYCHIAVIQDRMPNRIILLSVIDNLVKGSSGGAVQNFNLMFGFDETHSLTQLPLFP